MKRDTSLDILVANCDPAGEPPVAGLAPDARARQEALLSRLLADPHPAYPVPRPPRYLRTRRVLLPVLVVALMLGVATGGHAWWREHQRSVTAAQLDDYAGWSAVSTAVPDDRVEGIDRSCIDDLRSGDAGQHVDPGKVNRVGLERRGEGDLALYTLPDGRDYLCITSSNPAAARTLPLGSRVEPAVRTDVPADRISMPRDGVRCGDYIVGRGQTMCLWGAVGRRVTAVTLRTHRITVTTSISNGYYTAWWPVPWDYIRPMEETPRFDITLDDGTVVRDAEPLR